jgi:hypothetical protein
MAEYRHAPLHTRDSSTLVGELYVRQRRALEAAYDAAMIRPGEIVEVGQNDIRAAVGAYLRSMGEQERE